MCLRRALALSCLVVASSTWLAAQTASAPPAAQVAVAESIATKARVELSPEAMEAFLLKARTADARDAGKGVTGSRHATFSDGVITHDAQLQPPDPQRLVKQQYIMRVWDELVQNKDRNQTNVLYTTDWKIDDVSAMMARRDALVKHLDALIARSGEAAILFTL